MKDKRRSIGAGSCSKNSRGSRLGKERFPFSPQTRNDSDRMGSARALACGSRRLRRLHSIELNHPTQSHGFNDDPTGEAPVGTREGACSPRFQMMPLTNGKTGKDRPILRVDPGKARPASASLAVPRQVADESVPATAWNWRHPGSPTNARPETKRAGAFV